MVRRGGGVGEGWQADRDTDTPLCWMPFCLCSTWTAPSFPLDAPGDDGQDYEQGVERLPLLAQEGGVKEGEGEKVSKYWKNTARQVRSVRSENAASVLTRQQVKKRVAATIHIHTPLIVMTVDCGPCWSFLGICTWTAYCALMLLSVAPCC